MNKTTMDNLSDKLQSKVLRNLVNLADFQNCRLVSQKWKRTVMAACRDKFHLVYPLTDSTLYTVSELKEALVSFDVYAFTGKENEDAWPTSGLGPLMRTTEWLQFSGSKVNKEEIQKILGLAHDSLKTLSFKCVKNDLTHPLLEMQEAFGALRKLSIGFSSDEGINDTFTSFTNSLGKWNSLDCRVQLPLLESLNLYFDSIPRNGIVGLLLRITSKDLFQNYIAIAKLLLKYKQTLKEVQIERIFLWHDILFPSHVIQPEWTEMERGLETLDELSLNHLKLSTKRISQKNQRGIEIEVFGKPKNLKNVLFNYLICPYDHSGPLMATLSSFRNADSSYLTSIKMRLALQRFSDPTMVINVGGLRRCTNLKTLCLTIHSLRGPAQLFVRNLELLPKGISILHFESGNENRITIGEEILLNQRDLRWIIDNLRELESFRVSLVIPEQINGDADGANAQIQQQQDEEVNRLINVNVDTFRDLLAMPSLKALKLDMMTARGLRTTALVLQQVPGVRMVAIDTSLDVIRNYSDLCEGAGYTTTTTTRPDVGAGPLFGFATLTIQRNQN